MRDGVIPELALVALVDCLHPHLPPLSGGRRAEGATSAA